MKAIFAVSALAAAISAQAIAADTDATWGFTGEVNVGSVMDIEAEDRYHTLTDGDDGWNLDATLTIKNGGFTGSLAIEGSDGDADVSMGDLTYEEGIMLFGDVDSIITTETSVDDMSENTTYGVSKGFRLTFADLGLKVQAEVGAVSVDFDGDGDIGEGADDNAAAVASPLDGIDEEVASDLGFAAAYERDLGVATVTADLQYREQSTVADADETLPLYYGVKVVAMPVDMLTVTAGYTSGKSGLFEVDGTTVVLNADETVSSYGVRADVTVMEGVTAYGFYSQVTESALATQADANMEVGAAAAFGPLSVSASHHIQGDVSTTEAEAALSQDFAVSDQLTVNAHAGATWVTDTDMDWTAGVDATYAVSEMLSAYAGYEIDTAGDGTQLTAGVAYTTEGGASLTADYTNQNDVFDDADGVAHDITLKASYSF